MYNEEEYTSILFNGEYLILSISAFIFQPCHLLQSLARRHLPPSFLRLFSPTVSTFDAEAFLKSKLRYLLGTAKGAGSPHSLVPAVVVS